MSQKLVSGLSSACIVGAALAQAVPPAAFCCKYLYSMDDGGGEPGSGCTAIGSMTVSCEAGSPSAQEGDPLAREKVRNAVRPAKCTTVTLGTGGYFIRSDCLEPPVPGAIFVGAFNSDLCCWAAGSMAPTIFQTDAGYYVAKCEGPCGDGGIH